MSKGSISRPSAYIMSLTVSAWTNWPGRRNRARRRSAGLSISLPSGIDTFESMGALACQSTLRHCPVTVKCSSGIPWGSITPWHMLQVGLGRCSSSIARMVLGAWPGGNPGRADHDRSPVAIGRVQQHGALAEQAIAILVLKMDAAELRAVHRCDAEVFRQPFIEERIVGRQQLLHVLVFEQDAPQEEVDFG